MKMQHRPILLLVLAILVVSAIASSSTNHFPYKGASGYFSPRRDNLPRHFDFIVIGSGAAGSVVASRLSEDPSNSVLLLERGYDTSNKQLLDVPRRWDRTAVSFADHFTSVDFRNEPVVNWNENKGRVSSGIGLGGTTLINTMMFVRGAADDYNKWESDFGATGWSWNGVLPYFKKMETNPHKFAINPAAHGNNGPLHISPTTEAPHEDLIVVQAAAEYGIPFKPDHNNGNQLSNAIGGVSFHDFTIFNGTRQSAYKSYIVPHLNRRNLYVVDSAIVTKINFDRQKRAVSVTWFDKLNNEAVTSRARKEIILSAGALQTPKILQLSGIGDAALLDSLDIDVVSNRTGVGRNLMDHAISNLGVTDTGVPTPTDNLLNTETWNEWLANRTGPFSTTGSRLVLFLRTKYQNQTGDPRPDIQVIGGFPGPSIRAALYVLHPKSRGSVLLTSNDPFEDPLPIANAYVDPRDIDVHCEGLRILYRIYQKINPNIVINLGPTALFDDASCSIFITGSGTPVVAGPSILANSNTGQHFSGTARIGRPTDAAAVVDPRLRVIGVTGLRVADASVFPAITSGNTQAPSYMVGEKAAAMILQDN
jgi:choline dehydrogenase